MSLGRIYSRPRHIRYGGSDVRAGELTIGDLAAIDAVALAEAPDPLRFIDAAPTYLEIDPTGEELRKLVLSCYDEALDWPFDTGKLSVRTASWFGWLPMIAETVHLCLERGGMGLTRDESQSLILRQEPGDFQRLYRVAMAKDPLDTALAWADPWSGEPDDDAEEPHESERLDYYKAIWQIMESLSITHAQVAEMTLSQFRHAYHKGEAPDRANIATIPARMSRVEYARRQRRTFDPDQPPPDGWTDIIRARLGLPAPAEVEHEPDPEPFPPGPWEE